MCYLSGGQLPRVSELFSLECENGPVSAQGLYVYNAHVIYIIRHHKAKRSTNQEFYVAHYLPARASQVVCYYLAYIRPFVRMLQQEREENFSTHSSTLLFCSVQTPDRPWESRQLTAVLELHCYIDSTLIPFSRLLIRLIAVTVQEARNPAIGDAT